MPTRIIRHNNKIPLVSVDNIMRTEWWNPAYYIVGDGQAFYSEDGSSWTTYSISITQSSVAGRGGMVVSAGGQRPPDVAIADAGLNLQWSNKLAATWSAASYSQPIEIAVGGVDFSKEQNRWVAGGQAGSTGGGKVWWSDDAKNWTASTFSGGDMNLNKGNVLWDSIDGSWIVIDDGPSSALNAWYAYVSTDGKNFTVKGTFSAAGPYQVKSVVRAFSKYYVFSYLSDGSDIYRDRIAYTGDLVTWTVDSLPTSIYPGELAYSPSLDILVACGAKAGTAFGGTASMAWTDDGLNWTAVRTPNDMTNFNSVTWNPDLGEFIAVNSSGYITKSTTGKTWSTEVQITTKALYSIRWIK